MTAALLPRPLPGPLEAPHMSAPHTDTEQTVTPAMAAVELQVAVDQLTKPTLHRLNRAEPVPGSDEHQQIVDDRDLEQASWNRLSEAYRLRDTSIAYAALETIDLIERRRRARTVPTVEVPPLLRQLQDAIPNGSDSGHSSGGTGAARSPLALSALDFVTAVAEATGFRGPASSPTLGAHLTSWCSKACDDETQVLGAAEVAVGWPDRARAVLDPENHWTIPGACPDCGNTTAYVVQDGDTVRRPTLNLDTSATPQRARCLRCPARWVGESQLQQLNRVLAEARAAKRPARGHMALGYRVDPATLDLVEREQGDDRPPSCPMCKAEVNILQVDVGNETLSSWSCPNACRPTQTGHPGAS